MDRRRAIHTALSSALELYDNAPASNDLFWQINAANLFSRVRPLHDALELGMKFLTPKPDRVKQHDLGLLFSKMPADCQHKLDMAWIDAIEFFGYQTDRPHLQHLLPLESYLSKSGSNQRFEDFRYWFLEGNMDPATLTNLPLLHLNRELLRFLDDLISGFGVKVGGPFLLSDAIEQKICNALIRQFRPVHDAEYWNNLPRHRHRFTNYLKELARSDPATAKAIKGTLLQSRFTDAFHRAFTVWTARCETDSYHPAVRLDTTREAPWAATVAAPGSGQTLGYIDEAGNGTFRAEALHIQRRWFTTTREAAVSAIVAASTKICYIHTPEQTCHGRFIVTRSLDHGAVLLTIEPLVPSEISGDVYEIRVGSSARFYTPAQYDNDHFVNYHDGAVVENDLHRLVMKTSVNGIAPTAEIDEMPLTPPDNITEE